MWGRTALGRQCSAKEGLRQVGVSGGCVGAFSWFRQKRLLRADSCAVQRVRGLLGCLVQQHCARPHSGLLCSSHSHPRKSGTLSPCSHPPRDSLIDLSQKSQTSLSLRFIGSNWHYLHAPEPTSGAGDEILWLACTSGSRPGACLRMTWGAWETHGCPAVSQSSRFRRSEVGQAAS